MIGMDSNVESHELPEVFVFEAEHVSVVCTVIEGWIGIWNIFVITKAIMIDDSCNS